MKSDRFLLSILVGIGLLVVLALVFFFVRQAGQTYVSEDTPAGVVQNFILAVNKGDVERAYGYMMVEQNPAPTLETFTASLLSMKQGLSEISIQLDETVITGNQASVYLSFTYGAGGSPFSSPSRNQQTGTLVRQDGAWKITSLPYPLWSYDWNPAGPAGKIPVPAVPAVPVPTLTVTP